MNYGFKKNAKYCVAGMGRVASTMFTQFLISETSNSQVFGVHKRDFVEFDGKVVFLFGHPLNTVVSTHNGISALNLPEHYKHMGGKYSLRNSWIETDSLNMEDLFDDWYRKHEFDMVSVRYETMWDNLDKLSSYLGLSFSNFPKKKERKTDWTKYGFKGQLQETYGNLISKIESAEDFKIWK